MKNDNISPKERYDLIVKAESLVLSVYVGNQFSSSSPTKEELCSIISSLCKLVEKMEMHLPANLKFTGYKCTHCKGEHIGKNCPDRF